MFQRDPICDDLFSSMAYPEDGDCHSTNGVWIAMRKPGPLSLECTL